MASVNIKNVSKIYDDELKSIEKRKKNNKPLIRNLFKAKEEENFHSVQGGTSRTRAVDSINLEIPDGSFTVIVGPSGCGKSTLLRMIAGLESITEGEIYIGDKLVNDVKPGERNISMVFQNYAIYPTMTVRENITFGLENNNVAKDEIEKRVASVAETVGLSDFLSRKPDRLSGGQRQRVALARAVVKTPEIYIFDEPLSNLDAKLRADMRTEIISMHDRLKTTFIYVTHDQVEAMSMATQIVLLDGGRVVQVGSPMDLYNNPNSIISAEFMGTPAMNTVRMTNKIDKFGRELQANEYVGFRPEKARLVSLEEKVDYGVSVVGQILTKEMLGSENLYKIRDNYGTHSVKAQAADFSPGEEIQIVVSYDDLYYFNEEGVRI